MMLRAFFSVCVLLAVSQAEGPTPAPNPAAAVTKAAEHGAALSGITNKPKPVENNIKSFGNVTLSNLDFDGSMIQRALYVLIGITIIGVLYFLVRAVRLKKTTTQRKKYGLLSNYDDTVEMAQLESDEDDTTVYEAKSLRR
ncbi:protein FAM174C [Colossoma macropomum]|uniref:protein FAM174C n=1 Tax=Colossoma macropomum TaxID=42526 RepID=UPI0018647F45|nr:protein FAM174C [Colossoma macropomum]